VRPPFLRQCSMGPDVLHGEFEKALSELKNAKTTGIDGIPA